MRSKINWDAVGISTSIACAIHCAVLPLIITSLPLFGTNIIDNTAFECIMICLALLIGSFSLIHGYRKHHSSKWPLIFFGGGICLLFAKQYWHDYQLYILPFAIVLIVGAHLMNLRRSKPINAVAISSTDQAL